MTADPSSVRRAGARPVADAPVRALVDRADELARRWASALVAARPLAEMTAVPLEDLAREAPELCARLARALGSDGELEQLLAPAVERGAAAGRPAALAAWLAPANDASSAVRDIEVLRGVVWETALGELREPAVTQVAELSDRLAFVCAALLAALLARHELAGVVATPTAAAAAAAASTAASSRERVLYRSPPSSPGGRRAILIDERDETVRSRERERDATGAGRIAAPAYAPARSPREPAPEKQSSAPARAAPRARPWDTPLDGAGQTADGARDRASQGAVPDGAGAEMRVTRGPGATVDERA
ncbi:MAG TPA: hypothetical protein VGO29_05415 [Solirubrobacteraceae bacterium]|nr:hypothetical protein [Solirubrobacteraceae bacterium]